MRYCKTCKALYSKTDTMCFACKKKLIDITDINEPVRLCVVGGTERAMLCGLLSDAGIPYLETNVQPQGVPNDIISGYDVKLSNIAVLVPFSAVPKASELLSSIESVTNEAEPFLDEIIADIDHLKAKAEEPDEPMSSATKTTIRVITAILFFILVAVVVFGTDKLIELIKGLFGG